MKSKTSTSITAMMLFAALAIPVRLTAQGQKEDNEHQRYKLVDVGTFGGPASYLAIDGNGNGSLSAFLNIRGTGVGAADTSTPDPNFLHSNGFFPSDGFIVHAFQWQKGVLTDLGALPGGNNSFATWISANGLIAGFSENGVIDPQADIPQVNAVLWKDGQIINLGGYFSSASAVNNRGQVVGNTLNTATLPALNVRAFLWENGAMQDLGTLGGLDSFAFFVNERGQVAGMSFPNSAASQNCAFAFVTHPFLWDNGKMTDLGTLGGTCGLANALNNRGQVVGQSNLVGDLTYHPFLWDKRDNLPLTDLGTLGGDNGYADWINDAGEVVGKADLPGSQTHHAFLWNNGMMSDLGTVGSDPCSGALGINSRHQVVGFSSNCMVNLHAFLWEDGQITDLNVFNRPGSGLQRTTSTRVARLSAWVSLPVSIQRMYLPLDMFSR